MSTRIMTDQDPGVINAFKDYWQLGVAAVGILVAFIAGRERMRHRVDGLEQEVKNLAAKIDRLEGNDGDDRVVLAEIRATLNFAVKTLGEISAELKTKADK